MCPEQETVNGCCYYDDPTKFQPRGGAWVERILTWDTLEYAFPRRHFLGKFYLGAVRNGPTKCSEQHGKCSNFSACLKAALKQRAKRH